MAADSLDAKTRKILASRVEKGKEAQAYQSAEKQLLAIQAKQQENLTEARMTSQAARNQNQIMAQAAQIAMEGADQPIAVQGSVNPATQQIMSRYGVGQPKFQRSQSHSTQMTKQNVVINNNTTNQTTNNVTVPPNIGGPVQGRPIQFKQGGDGSANKFKVWMSQAFAKQDAEAKNRERVYERRESALTRSANKMMRKLEEIGKTMSERMDPRNIGTTLTSQIKVLGFLFGLHYLSRNWKSILKAVNKIQTGFEKFTEWLGFGQKGEGDSGLVKTIKYMLGGKEAGENKSILELFKEIFYNEDQNKPGLYQCFRDYFDELIKDRKEALKTVTSKEYRKKTDTGGGWGNELLDGLVNILGDVFGGVKDYLGDILTALISGTSGLTGILNKQNLQNTAKKSSTDKHGYKEQWESYFGGNGGASRGDTGYRNQRKFIYGVDTDKNGNLVAGNQGSFVRQGNILVDALRDKSESRTDDIMAGFQRMETFLKNIESNTRGEARYGIVTGDFFNAIADRFGINPQDPEWQSLILESRKHGKAKLVRVPKTDEEYNLGHTTAWEAIGTAASDGLGAYGRNELFTGGPLTFALEGLKRGEAAIEGLVGGVSAAAYSNSDKYIDKLFHANDPLPPGATVVNNNISEYGLNTALLNRLRSLILKNSGYSGEDISSFNDSKAWSNIDQKLSSSKGTEAGIGYASTIGKAGELAERFGNANQHLGENLMKNGGVQGFFNTLNVASDAANGLGIDTNERWGDNVRSAILSGGNFTYDGNSNFIESRVLCRGGKVTNPLKLDIPNANNPNEYHLICWRYSKYSVPGITGTSKGGAKNGENIDGVIYEYNTNEIICYTIEDSNDIRTCGNDGNVDRLLLPGGNKWCTTQRGTNDYHVTCANYCGSLANGRGGFGKGFGTPLSMLSINGSGCLLHPGGDISWSTGCLLCGEKSNKGKRTNCSTSAYGGGDPSKIAQSTNPDVMYWRNIYDHVVPKICSGIKVYLHFRTKLDNNSPQATGEITASDTISNTNEVSNIKQIGSASENEQTRYSSKLRQAVERVQKQASNTSFEDLVGKNEFMWGGRKYVKQGYQVSSSGGYNQYRVYKGGKYEKTVNITDNKYIDTSLVALVGDSYAVGMGPIFQKKATVAGIKTLIDPNPYGTSNDAALKTNHISSSGAKFSGIANLIKNAIGYSATTLVVFAGINECSGTKENIEAKLKSLLNIVNDSSVRGYVKILLLTYPTGQTSYGGEVSRSVKSKLNPAIRSFKDNYIELEQVKINQYDKAGIHPTDYSGLADAVIKFLKTKVNVSPSSFQSSEEKTPAGNIPPSSPQLSNGDGATPGSATGQKGDIIAYAVQHFINKGYTPEQAAGIVGNLMGEGLLTKDYGNIYQLKGEAHKTMGIAGFYGAELGANSSSGSWQAQQLKAYAESTGKNINTLGTQLDYLTDVAIPGMSGKNGRHLENLSTSATVADSAYVWGHEYERFAGYDADPATSKNYQNRIAMGHDALAIYNANKGRIKDMSGATGIGNGSYSQGSYSSNYVGSASISGSAGGSSGGGGSFLDRIWDWISNLPDKIMNFLKVGGGKVNKAVKYFTSSGYHHGKEADWTGKVTPSLKYYNSYKEECIRRGKTPLSEQDWREHVREVTGSYPIDLGPVEDTSDSNFKENFGESSGTAISETSAETQETLNNYGITGKKLPGETDEEFWARDEAALKEAMAKDGSHSSGLVEINPEGTTLEKDQFHNDLTNFINGINQSEDPVVDGVTKTNDYLAAMVEILLKGLNVQAGVLKASASSVDAVRGLTQLTAQTSGKGNKIFTNQPILGSEGIRR